MISSANAIVSVFSLSIVPKIIHTSNRKETKSSLRPSMVSRSDAVLKGAHMKNACSKVRIRPSSSRGVSIYLCFRDATACLLPSTLFQHGAQYV